MIDRLFGLIAPHVCCSCGQPPSILCEDCKNYIVEESFSQCIDCLCPTWQSNTCVQCADTSGWTGVWVVGERHDALKRLVDQYKFAHARAAAEVIASLMATRLPVLPSATQVYFVPDIPPHRRQRGFDHMRLIASLLAKRLGLDKPLALERRTFHSQRGLRREERLSRQNNAFAASVPKFDSPALLIDDIYTTGSTIRAGVQALRQAGYETIFVAIIARQPLDSVADL